MSIAFLPPGRATLAALLLAVAFAPAHASDLDLTAAQLSQAEFQAFSHDLGATLSYKGLVPAEPLGITGFDIGGAATFTNLSQDGLWKRLGADVDSVAPTTTLRAYKGLPFDVDVGVMIGQVPGTGATLTGGEVRWAALPGDMFFPAVAVRVGATRLAGVDDLSAHTLSADLSISKGFLFATPYAGVGTVRTTATPDASTGLQRVAFSQARVFGGVNLNLGLMNVDLEVDRTGGVQSAGVKLGLRF